MGWKKFIYLCHILVLFQSFSFGQSETNETDPEFPDISPLLQSLLTEEPRDEKVMKNPVNVYTNTKFIVTRPNGDKNEVGSQTGSNKQDISETDMYLLTAIEKLSFRMDAMEKRLRRTEELLYHVMEGSNIKRQDACPENFTRVARNCYYFGERQFNWKSAASMCKSLGSNLIEIESRDEYMEVVTYIQAHTQLRGYDFWTGGLNPGLLWIWANSARPILPKKPSNRPEETIYGSGRCLKLSINPSKLYQYHGMDCAARLKFICEHEENSTIRALKKIQKSLLITEDP